MIKQMKKILIVSLVVCFMFFSSALALVSSEISGSLGQGLDTGVDALTYNCNPLTVDHGTVAAYPACTINCASGYALNGVVCQATGAVIPEGGYGGGGGGGGAPQQGDRTAPSISDVSIVKTDTTATITWKTTEASWTWLLWGTTASYGQEVKTEAFVTSHSVALTGLTPNTTYYFQIKTKDAAGNTLYGNGLSFKTSAAGSTTPVTITPAGQTSSSSQMPALSKPISQMSRGELLTYLINLIVYLISIGRLHF
jgi:hypothetical protein